MESPKIYVASLTDYNNGRLEGKFFDFADYSDASELMKAIDDMLKELTKKYNDGEVREEWAVHDYENIPSSLASEYMGERDFEVIYELMEVAEDSNIPLDVLMERAGDVGSDDYQAIVDSLVMVVDGSDETDIVYELEQQMGALGNDFWKNHTYIDDVTERVMYGEDVDRYREDILYENPDMDENEAEEQAEEMASDEAERRKDDLIGYLEEMGYEDIPTFVSKDYESAWNELSNDYDVIRTDDKMYVFSNNYAVGGVVIGGLLGAYLGYNYGLTTKRKKLALGGSTNSGLSWHQDHKRHNKSQSYELPTSKRKFAKGGSIGFKGLSNKVAKRYEGKKVAPKYQGEYGKRYSKNEAIEVGNKVAGKVYNQQQGSKMADGGMVGSEIEFNQYGEPRTGTIYEDYGDDTYGVQSGTSKVLVEKDDITRTLEPQMKRKFGFFADGGGVGEISEEDAKEELEKLADKQYVSLRIGNDGSINMIIQKTNRSLISSMYQPYDSYKDALRSYVRVSSRFEQGGGVEEERVYIEYLNKDKGFKRDRIEFDSYKEAVEWGKKHFEKFNSDMINYFDGGGNVRDDEWYQMWNHKNNYSSWNTYSLKRGIEDYDIKEQNGHTLTDSEIAEIEAMFKELHKRGETYKLGDRQNNLR